MSFGCDYAFSPHPPASALKAAGARFVCRYVSPEAQNDTNGKNISKAECAEILKAGIELVLVYEPFAANWMLGGHSAGVTAAKHFDAVAKAIDVPGIIMYCAADFDATPGNQTDINNCLAGAASVVGSHRTGIYGDFYVIQRAVAAGKAAYAWQTPAWSGGQWSSADGIRQGFGVTVGGISVDADTSAGSDFGQFPRPKDPASSGPYRHVIPAGYGRSIDYLAEQRNTTVDHLFSYSLKYCNPGHDAIINAYKDLRASLIALKQPLPALPTGFVYYTSNP